MRTESPVLSPTPRGEKASHSPDRPTTATSRVSSSLVPSRFSDSSIDSPARARHTVCSAPALSLPSSASSATRFWPPETDTPQALIFLFVNPTSGGNAAASFTKSGLAHAILTDPDVELYIADIRHGPSGDKPAFNQLKLAVQHAQDNPHIIPPRIFAIMAGGDGTVLWGISEMWEHKIDDSYVAIGVIPYGTGNDFARALDWNAFNALSPFHEDMKSLKNLVSEWLRAPIVLHDIWNVVVTLREGGQFKQIDSRTRKKKTLGDASGNPSLVLTKKMNNYFSIGIESRIGIGFDRHRKATAFQNKVVYMHEGVKKSLFHHNIRIPKLITKMSVGENEDVSVVFDGQTRKLTRCASLIASNIPSFASGLNIWHNARRVGVDLSSTAAAEKLLRASQVMGDGLLEWVSFSGIPSLGTEQIVEGLGKRVCQDKGPFLLEFQDQLADGKRVYFQIDGEFYQMTKPAKLEISLFRRIRCLGSPKCINNPGFRLE